MAGGALCQVQVQRVRLGGETSCCLEIGDQHAQSCRFSCKGFDSRSKILQRTRVIRIVDEVRFAEALDV